MSETTAENGAALRVIGDFELLSKLGQGGMGAVFKARQRSLDRVVALKILPRQIAQRDPVFVQRFIREARVSARLNHPNIVTGIEVGQDEKSGLYYFAMEYIDGPTARDLLKKEGKLDEHRALRIARAVGGALACARKEGIVHRDIKPDNILLTSRDEVKLADLGLARRVDSDEADGTAQSGPAPADAALTQSGATVGTPYYMAPEQARGLHDQIDVRTDLYALGATLFHLLAGEPPYTGSSSAIILSRHMNAPVPDLRKTIPNSSPAVSALITKLLQKNPAQRIQTPEDLIREVDAILKDAATPGGAAAARQKVGAMRGEAAGTVRRGGETKSRDWSMPWVGLAASIVVLLVLLVALRSTGRQPAAPTVPAPAVAAVPPAIEPAPLPVPARPAPVVAPPVVPPVELKPVPSDAAAAPVAVEPPQKEPEPAPAPAVALQPTPLPAPEPEIVAPPAVTEPVVSAPPVAVNPPVPLPPEVKKPETPPVAPPPARKMKTTINASGLELNDDLAAKMKLTDAQRKKMSEGIDQHLGQLLGEYESGTGRNKSGMADMKALQGVIEKHVGALENELGRTLNASQMAQWREYRKRHRHLSVSTGNK